MAAFATSLERPKFFQRTTCFFVRPTYVNPTIYDDYPGELYLTVVEFPPSVPEIPTGQVLGDTNTTYYYSTVSTDPGGDNISYGWDWDGDYIVDEWTDILGLISR